MYFLQAGFWRSGIFGKNMQTITLNDIQFIISIATLLGIAFAIYKTFRDPDIKNKESIDILKATCKFRCENNDKQMAVISENYNLLKENHIRHIEEDISQIKISLTKIMTILEEREKYKAP